MYTNYDSGYSSGGGYSSAGLMSSVFAAPKRYAYYEAVSPLGGKYKVLSLDENPDPYGDGYEQPRGLRWTTDPSDPDIIGHSQFMDIYNREKAIKDADPTWQEYAGMAASLAIPVATQIAAPAINALSSQLVNLVPLSESATSVAVPATSAAITNAATSAVNTALTPGADIGDIATAAGTRFGTGMVTGGLLQPLSANISEGLQNVGMDAGTANVGANVATGAMKNSAQQLISKGEIDPNKLGIDAAGTAAASAINYATAPTYGDPGTFSGPVQPEKMAEFQPYLDAKPAVNPNYGSMVKTGINLAGQFLAQPTQHKQQYAGQSEQGMMSVPRVTKPQFQHYGEFKDIPFQLYDYKDRTGSTTKYTPIDISTEDNFFTNWYNYA